MHNDLIEVCASKPHQSLPARPSQTAALQALPVSPQAVLPVSLRTPCSSESCCVFLNVADSVLCSFASVVPCRGQCMFDRAGGLPVVSGFRSGCSAQVLLLLWDTLWDTTIHQSTAGFKGQGGMALFLLLWRSAVLHAEACRGRMGPQACCRNVSNTFCLRQYTVCMHVVLCFTRQAGTVPRS